MHLAPIRVFVTCDRCNREYSATPNQQLRVWICPDCRRQEAIERKRHRSCWSPGDYHMIHDPDKSWSPAGTYLNRRDIIDLINGGCIAIGTVFECRGKRYEVKRVRREDYFETRLIMIEGSIESIDTEGTWQRIIGNARNAAVNTD